MQSDNKATSPEIVFVNYLSRSGSTLLCQLLDSYRGILVGIEAGFPGAIAKLIPDEYRQITDDGLLTEYLDELYLDIRFREWNVDRQRLFERLKETGYPVTFRDILLTCLDEYFNGREGMYVHKAGYYIDILDEVRATFGGNIRNIFIIRDPRAVYSSQNSAACIYSGESMGRCLANFVYQYKKRARIAAADKSGDLLCIRYEDLIKDSEKTMAAVLSFLAMPQARPEDSDYATRIPDGQKQLHVNVARAPNESSFGKWRQALKPYEVQFIQRKLSGEMRALGYAPVSPGSFDINGLAPYLLLELKYLYASFLRSLRHA